MRKMAQLTPTQQSPQVTTAFYGYNHNERINDGEMYDMQNMGSELFPLLSPRKKRGITSFDVAGSDPVPLTGIHGRDALVYIRGTKVYWNHTEVQGITVSAESTALPKKIVSFGAYVLIWPDKVYFNTVHLADCGSMDRLFSISSESVSLSMCRGDGTDYDMTSITVSETPPSDPTNGQLWIDQSGDVDVLRQYISSTQEWLEVATTYVKIAATGIGASLKEYDVVEISGLEADSTLDERIRKQVDELNTSMIVYFRGDNYIVVAGLLSQTHQAGSLETATVHADLKVPDLDYVCESNNRLWGCRYGWVNGAVVNEIHATKLGDFRAWNCYMGLSTDSYTASVGTDGPFTGCAVQRGYPVFFKENCIHKVSGTSPSSFSISTLICRGVQNGSWRSVCVVNEAIYYKSRKEVMVFDGSMPASVGDQLGNVLYSDARAGAILGKYYISMKNAAGHWVLFNLDTKHGTWQKEDSTKALGFGAVDDELFYIDEEKNTLVSVGGSYGAQEDDFDWAAEFGRFGTDYANSKYLSMFKIRVYLDPDAYIRLWVKYDNSTMYEFMGEKRGDTLRSFTLPVIPKRCDHLRFKVTGKGEARIYSISRVLEVGGDGV